MSDHYFSSRPVSKSKEYRIETELLGYHLIFRTDNGVFSKNDVDFGSRLLIESVEIQDGDSILDLGCAYGVVGIAIAKACKVAKVTMVEINERACQLARENATRNNVAEQVEVFHGDGFEPIQDKEFDHVLFNPPIRAGKEVVYSLFKDASDYLKPNAALWIVIRKQQGAESACRRLQDIFASVDVVTKKKGYWILCAKK